MPAPFRAADDYRQTLDLRSSLVALAVAHGAAQTAIEGIDRAIRFGAGISLSERCRLEAAREFAIANAAHLHGLLTGDNAPAERADSLLLSSFAPASVRQAAE